MPTSELPTVGNLRVGISEIHPVVDNDDDDDEEEEKMDNNTNIELSNSQHLGFAWSSIIVAA